MAFGHCNEERIPPVLRTDPLPLEGGEMSSPFRRKGGAKRTHAQRDEGDGLCRGECRCRLTGVN